MDGTRARATVVLTILLAVLGGCSTRPPVPGEPVAEPPEAGRQWACEPFGGQGSGRIDEGLVESWTLQGGAMLSVHRSRQESADSPGWPTRDGAAADALASATTAALDLLEQRGVSYDPPKRDEIVEETVDAALRGAEPPFPRIRVVEQDWDECVAVSMGSPADADTSWLTSVLVEYPIGLLRGDVNNVVWERGRAANEAEVLRASCEGQFAAGHWHDGLLDVLRVADVVIATGVPLSGMEDIPRPGEDDGASSTDGRLREALRSAGASARAAMPLAASAEEGIVVVDTGAPESELIRFRVSYEWNGVSFPAIGVPVRFEMRGASAVLSADPWTDEAGIATCRVLAAYGPPGEYEFTVSVDTEAAHEALNALEPTGPRSVLPDAALWLLEPLAGRAVHLVDGAHAVSVCAEFGGQRDADAAQAMAGFVRRMERDGFRMGECDPEIDVVVTGALSMTVRGGSKSPAVQATLSASVFDQRTALEIGRTSVQATEPINPEDTDEDTREAEVLALKEAGRLLAAYFGPRILASGR